MELTVAQRMLIERVINVFETGSPAGDYGAISIYADGPHDIRQITYGRSQTTEFGNLRELIADYVQAGGMNSESLRVYADEVGTRPLANDAAFKRLLRAAGRDDPVMKQVQDRFFDRRYFSPAKAWCEQEGFDEPLSMLIVYDSFIHSGGILWAIRGIFPERTPLNGGSERLWTSQYVSARNNWLRNHRREVVRRSSYRTRDLMRQVDEGNWDLSVLPIKANGVAVM